MIVSNFLIENPSSRPFSLTPTYLRTQIHLGTVRPSNQNNNTISDCIIRNTEGIGIRVDRIGRDNNIINNEISQCHYGIQAFSPINVNIKGNVITDIRYVGIYFLCGMENVSYNTIKRCDLGMRIRGSNNIIYGNDFEDCSTGISSEDGGLNCIIKNNFKNYSYFKSWFQVALLFGWTKDRWEGNYWDTWSGVGPKRILGERIICIFVIT